MILAINGFSGGQRSQKCRCCSKGQRPSRGIQVISESVQGCWHQADPETAALRTGESFHMFREICNLTPDEHCPPESHSTGFDDATVGTKLGRSILESLAILPRHLKHGGKFGPKLDHSILESATIPPHCLGATLQLGSLICHSRASWHGLFRPGLSCSVT